MVKKKIFVIGGDMRQYYLAMKLFDKGYDIACYGMKRLEEEKNVEVPETLALGMVDNGVILLPVPVLQDNLQIKSTEKKILLKELEDSIRKGQIVFGGNLPKSLIQVCKEKEAICVDYMNLDEVTVENAQVTAEGAILEAALLGNIRMQNSNCLVIGFGKCGEALAQKLSAWGAVVTIMARSKEARSKAEAYGYYTRDMFGKERELKTDKEKEQEKEIAKRIKYQFVFNTVPAMVLDKKAVDIILTDRGKEEYPIIVDIASLPGGVDFEYCREKEVKAEIHQGIPGKYAPKTAGVILAKAVLNRIENSSCTNK
ncbi:MAG: hypothetical protein IJN92_09650 [Lachnospiraceae bacterium]|nr:hypothetical protein [Lachnospiraceae bacterium]